MAEVVIGDVVARLRADSTEFQRGMEAAAQALQRFQASTQQQASQMNQAMTPALRQASQGFQGMTQAQSSAGQQTAALTQQLASLSQQTQQSGQQAKALGEIWKGALSVAGGVGIVTSLQSATQAMVDFGRSAVETATKLEGLRTGFSFIFGGQQAGAANFRDVINLANRLGVEVVGLAESFRKFEAAARGTALQGEAARRTFESMTVAIRATGGGAQEVQRGLLALEQMISKGKVSAEELRGQLGEVLPGALQIAARALGTTTQELEKMMAAGIESTSFVKALEVQLRQEFGPAAEAAGRTASAAFARLGNEITLFRESLATSGIVQALRDIANWSAEILKSWREAGAAREKAFGGPAPEIPTGLPMSAEMRRRQEEIARLRQAAGGQQPGMTGAEGPLLAFEGTPPQVEERVRQLQAEQRAAIERLQRQLLAEGAGPGATGPGPADAAMENIKKAIDEGRVALEQLDRRAQVMPGFDAVGAKLEAWNKTMDAIAASLNRIPEPLQKAIMPQIDALVAQANQVLAALQAEKDAPAAAARELAEMRRRQSEAERAAEQARRQAEQEALAGDRERRQQAFATGREYLRALEEEMAKREQSLATLRRLQSSYTETKQARDALTAAEIAGQHAGDEEVQQLAETVIALAKTREAYLEEVAALKERFTALKQNADAMRENERAQQSLLQRQQAQLEEGQLALAGPPTLAGDPRLELELQRTRAQLVHLGATPETLGQEDEMADALRAQQRLNYEAGLFVDVSRDIGSAWSTALSSVADGTATVAQAFQAMTKSILRSMQELAAQEATKAFIGLGLRLLTGAALGGGGGYTTPGYFNPGLGGESAMGVGAGINPLLFQHGGAVNRPTFAMLAEHGQPEAVVNQGQMNQMMQEAVGRAGGPMAQGAVSIHNYPSKAEADMGAARERALGHAAIVNEVMADLRKGEGSMINRTIRTLQR
jgi:tape measure domain-containing protein